MARYQRQFGARRRFSRRLLLLLFILAIIAVIGTVLVREHYTDNLRPVGGSTAEIHITIPTGSSVSTIARQLYSTNLIRSKQAFEWYVSSHNQRDKLQAGTYSFNRGMSTPQIADAIASGDVATDLVTIIPGQRLDQIKDTFIQAGFDPAAVTAALQAQRYRATYPALADNPSSTSLEGFLYPDSYQLTADTDPSEIVAESLKGMQKRLTSDVRAGFAKQGLSVYEGVTLASIVEQEVPKQADRTRVAQVFLSRLKQGMPLGSDVTVFYAKESNKPAYDTTDRKGLPPGPIGTVSEGSLAAVANPAKTQWLYFVSGDNDITYFSKTYDQHKENIAKYCHQKCPATN